VGTLASNLRSTLAIGLAAAFVLSSCHEPSPTAHIATLPSATATLRPSPTRTGKAFPTPGPTWTRRPTITSIPTVLPSQSRLFRDLLNSLPCQLPCFLGITPGNTNFTHAIAILESLGASYLGGDDIRPYGGRWFSFLLNSGHPPSHGETPSPFGFLVSTQIILSTNPQGIVQSLIVRARSIPTSESRIEYRDYFSHYDVPGIMSQLGPPLQIFTQHRQSDSDRNAWLLFDYTHMGVFIDLRGTPIDNRICYRGAEDVGSVSLELKLFQPGPGTTAGSFIHLDTGEWSHIQDVFGIDANQYYANITTHPEQCLYP
jgi:hypothetical protein